MLDDLARSSETLSTLHLQSLGLLQQSLQVQLKVLQSNVNIPQQP